MAAKTKYVGALAAAVGALVAVGVLLLMLLVGEPQSAGATPVSQPATPRMSEQEALDAYKKLPLSFIPNEGQTDKAVRYYAQGAGYGFFFAKEGAMLSFANGEGRGHALALEFLGADPEATLRARDRLVGEVNYLVRNDPAEWQQGLPTYGELLYEGLWPGIDMAVRGEGGKLKYEFHLKPGSSVEDVRLAYRGAKGLSVGSEGELLIQTPLGVVKDTAPVGYQRIGGERVAVESRYTLKGSGVGYGFEVGAYDPRYPLVIDPVLDYSTFLGGTDLDGGSGIAVREGKAYVTGTTYSFDYPTTTGALDTSYNGYSDAFVTKLNASGSALDYSTFLGGTNGDVGRDIAVDGSGRAYVTGDTNSADYPTTTAAFDTSYNGYSDAFVTKLNASGSALAYSTFLGGTSGEVGAPSSGIAVDAMGRAYVTGTTNSADYPTTRGAFDTTYNGNGDAFVTKLNTSGSGLDYSTFLGGQRSYESGRDIAVRDERAYVTGVTTSTDYPTTRGAFDRTFNGSAFVDEDDAFVTKLNASGSALAYSTFLGGTEYDQGYGIAVDAMGRAYVTGYTDAANYPTTRGAFDTSLYEFGGDRDAFVTKLNASGSALDYSTFLGTARGNGVDEGHGIAVDGRSRAYVTGITSSTNYPTTNGAFDTSLDGGWDAFVTKLNASGSALAYSTFLGGTSDTDNGEGIAVDGSGRAYVTGETFSSDYPTTPGAFDTSYNGGHSDDYGSDLDAFVTKLPTS